MRQSMPILTLSLVADGEVKKHRFVGHDGEQVDTAGAKALGVSRTDADDGDDLAVDVLGTTVVEAGGSFDKGAALKSDADGKAVDSVSDEDFVLAEALEESGGDEEFVEVLLVRYQKPEFTE